jgi:hypothetical protein
VAKGSLLGRTPWTGLVHAWFLGSKLVQQAEALPYDEYATATHDLLDDASVQAILEQIWPEGEAPECLED